MEQEVTMFRTLTTIRIPTWLVLGTALALAALDALVAGSIAQDDKALAPNGETPIPAAIPVDAFLARIGTHVTEVADLRVEVITQRDGRAALRITNPTAEVKRRGWNVDCWETSGSLSSRMGPMTTRMHTELVVVELAPGATVLEPLEWIPGPAVDTTFDWNGGGFRTRQISLRAVGTPSITTRAEPPPERLFGGQLRPGVAGALAVLTVPLVPAT